MEEDEFYPPDVAQARFDSVLDRMLRTPPDRHGKRALKDVRERTVRRRAIKVPLVEQAVAEQMVRNAMARPSVERPPTLYGPRRPE